MRWVYATAGGLLSACTVSIADVVSDTTSDAGEEGTVPDSSVDADSSGDVVKDTDASMNDAALDARPPDAGEGGDAGATGTISFVQIGYVKCGSKITCALTLSTPVVAGDAIIV